MTELRELAKRTAARAHINHTYNDRSYLENHLERVAITAHAICYKEGITNNDFLDTVFCIALLHDYLEDCFDYSITTLEEEVKKLENDFNKAIANGVLLLSKNYYSDNPKYLETVSQNEITKIIKAADRISNILSLPEVKIKKKRIQLFTKYKNEMALFRKYDIYPDLIEKSMNKIEQILSAK